jgi:hypothetical protein
VAPLVVPSPTRPRPSLAWSKETRCQVICPCAGGHWQSERRKTGTKTVNALPMV